MENESGLSKQLIGYITHSLHERGIHDDDVIAAYLHAYANAPDDKEEREEYLAQLEEGLREVLRNSANQNKKQNESHEEDWFPF